MNVADNENNLWASKDSRVCSKHFADGKHTLLNWNLNFYCELWHQKPSKTFITGKKYFFQIKKTHKKQQQQKVIKMPKEQGQSI